MSDQTATPAPRAKSLDPLAKALGSGVVFRGERSLVAKGDCTELLAAIPDASVALVLVDPPYHSTKKGNIHGDRAFAADAEYLEWMRSLAREWKRILRRNGAAYVFCAPPMASRLEVALAEFFRPLSHIT